MKRIIAFLTVLVLLLSLCGCDSSDYKKAGELFDMGDYEAARAMYAALGDYEDSASKVKLCDYRMAVDYMENGEYEEARQLFTELGDYMDCADLLARVKYYMFLDYVEQNGPFQQLEDNTGYSVSAKEGVLHLAFVMTFSGVINMDVGIGAAIDEDGIAVIVGTEETSSYAADWAIESTYLWDISTYSDGATLEWDEYNISGYTAKGTATENDGMLKLLLTSCVSNFTKLLATTVQESGLDLTMADIGFLSY